VTTIVVDHVTKNVDGRGRYAIGSERKIGGADVHLGLHVVRRLRRGGSGLVRIDTHKDRPGYLADVAAELELSSDPETHQIAWTFGEASGGTSDGWKPFVLMERVLEYVASADEPMSRYAVAEAVRGKREYVFVAIKELLAENRLALEGRKLVLTETVPENGSPLREKEPGTEFPALVNSSQFPGTGWEPGTALRVEDDDIPF